VDGDALQNGILALSHARGIFEDGLVFDMPECDGLPQPRSFADAFFRSLTTSTSASQFPAGRRRKKLRTRNDSQPASR